MGIFSRKEQRAETIEDTLLTAVFNGDSMTREKALNIPSVASCVEYISSTIAMLPIKLYKDNGEETQEQTADSRIRLLNDDTGDTLNAYQMKKAFIADVLLKGNGYIYINKERNKVKSLHYVDERNIFVQSNYDPIYKRNEILINGERFADFDFIKVTRNTVDGATGTGILQENSTLLALVYNSLIYENNLVKKGGNKKGFLKSERKLTKEAVEEMKNAWRNLYSNNENNMMILNDGVDFKESSNSSVEMQLKENKEINSELICQIFNLSPKVISGVASDREVANAVKSAILPLIKAIQTALNKDYLLESEKASYYWVVDTTELLKGDLVERYKAYEIALRSNFMQLDEIRYREDLKPLGFNYIKLGLQDVLFNPQTNEVYTPNTNQKTNLNGGEKLEN